MYYYHHHYYLYYMCTILSSLFSNDLYLYCPTQLRSDPTLIKLLILCREKNSFPLFFFLLLSPLSPFSLPPLPPLPFLPFFSLLSLFCLLSIPSPSSSIPSLLYMHIHIYPETCPFLHPTLSYLNNYLVSSRLVSSLFD